MEKKSYDVVIVGSGLAGGCLARQLKLTLPSLSILQLDARESLGGYRVGESTVEVGGYYLEEMLELKDYLEEHHLPKNGLRFFFDTKEKDLPLHEMSEIGSGQFPLIHHAYQLNRDTFEPAIAEMNEESGVDLKFGTKVKDLQLSETDNHTVEYEDHEGAKEVVSCRWLIDASGYVGVVAQKLKLRHRKAKQHSISAFWGWFEDMNEMKSIENADWKARVNDVPRDLSTNHFMYKGYWIWVIPLKGKATSVGIVYDTSVIDPVHSEKEFLEFLKEHDDLKGLLKGAKPIQTGSMLDIPFTTEQFLSGKRWGTVGFAAAFSDPLFSLSTNVIAYDNTYLTDLIKADIVDKNEDMPEMADFYEEELQDLFKSYLSQSLNQYGALGSFELWRIKMPFELERDFLRRLWPFIWGYRDVEGLKTANHWMKKYDLIEGYIEKLFPLVYEALEKRSQEYTHNKNQYQGYPISWLERLMKMKDPVECREERENHYEDLCQGIMLLCIEKILGYTSFAQSQLVQEKLDLDELMSLTDDIGDPKIDDETLHEYRQGIEVELKSQLRALYSDIKITDVDVDFTACTVSVKGVFDSAEQQKGIEIDAQGILEEKGDNSFIERLT